MKTRTKLLKFPRKLKKRIIKTFGRGTYAGLREGILYIRKYHENRGCFVAYTEKGKASGGKGSRFYHPNQYNPYVTFKNYKIA